TDSCYIATLPGNYSVFDCFQCCCIMSNGLSLAVTDFNNPASTISISPNPFSDEVTFSFGSTTAYIKLYNMMGNLLFSITGNQGELNRSLNELLIYISKGVYIFQVETTDRSNAVIRKLIKM